MVGTYFQLGSVGTSIHSALVSIREVYDRLYYPKPMRVSYLSFLREFYECAHLFIPIYEYLFIQLTYCDANCIPMCFHCI